jgi:hypothetical protein
MVKHLHTATRIALLSALVATSGVGQARITEPPSILYGEVAWQGQPISASDTDVSLTIDIGSVEIARYRMGTSSRAGNFYVLTLPLESLNPRTEGTVSPGDQGFINIEVSGVKTALLSVQVGGRGEVMRLDVSEDSDRDGIPDITDNDDDNDQIPDMYERDNGLDPLFAGDAQLDPDGNGTTNLDDYLAYLESLNPIDPEPQPEPDSVLYKLLPLIMNLLEN